MFELMGLWRSYKKKPPATADADCATVDDPLTSLLVDADEAPNTAPKQSEIETICNLLDAIVELEEPTSTRSECSFDRPYRSVEAPTAATVRSKTEPLRAELDDFLEFGGKPFADPESCTDRPYRTLSQMHLHGTAQLSGNAFKDLPQLIERIDSVTSTRLSKERSLLRGLLERVIEHLTGDRSLALSSGTVSAEQYAMLRVTNQALEDDALALRRECNKLHEELNNERFLLNKYMEGAMAGRAAHTITVRTANELHKHLLQLINTHPYYETEFNPIGDKLGRLPLAKLKSVFPTKRNLALTSAQDILAIEGVGPVTLGKIIEVFKADDMPAFCTLSLPDLEKQYGDWLWPWRYVNRTNQQADYRWALPDCLLGAGAHVVRKFNGASYLSVAFNQADNPSQASVDSSTSEPSPGIDRPQHENLADELDDDDIPWAWPPTSTAEAPEPSNSRSAIGCSALQSDP